MAELGITPDGGAEAEEEVGAGKAEHGEGGGVGGAGFCRALCGFLRFGGGLGLGFSKRSHRAVVVWGLGFAREGMGPRLRFGLVFFWGASSGWRFYLILSE
jgi:hypothetical protein